MTMSTLDTNRTLGDLVTENPARAAVLEALGLDYCCGGGRPLHRACAEAGLDVATAARLLAAPPVTAAIAADAEPDPRALSLAALVDHIEATHHAWLKAELPRLRRLAAKVRSAHGGRHAELHEVTDILEGLAGELELHLGKEEGILFPAIRAMDAAAGAIDMHCGSIVNPIRVMEHEHDEAGHALSRLRELSGDYRVPDDGCGTWREFYAGLVALERDLHRHIHKENNVLFPRVLALAAATGAAAG